MCIIRSIYLVIGAYWHTSIPAYQAYQANQLAWLVTIQLPASSSWSYPAIQLSGYPGYPLSSTLPIRLLAYEELAG